MDRRKFLKTQAGLSSDWQLRAACSVLAQQEAKRLRKLCHQPATSKCIGATYTTTVTSHTDTATCAMLFEAAKGQLDFVSVTPSCYVAGYSRSR